MDDVIFALLAFDQYTVMVGVCFVAIAFWLIREILDSFTLAFVSVPILMIGALAANYLFRTHFVVAVNDKDTNVVVASAVGVVTALSLLLLSIWIAVLMSERRTKNRRLVELPDLPPRDA
jgi:hypothetical protein